MSDLPLESEVSAVFPRKRIEVRPGVQLWISSGTLEHKLQRKASTTSSIFELAYSRKNPLYSKLGGASVEIKPGYSNLGFLGQTTGYSEYNCGEEIQLYVREERLEKAFSLLQDGQHNVSQTAFAVGYTNISHFSEAFHSYFGVFPHMLVNRTAPNSNNEV